MDMDSRKIKSLDRCISKCILKQTRDYVYTYSYSREWFLKM